jgi:hypothetical protein
LVTGAAVVAEAMVVVSAEAEVTVVAASAAAGDSAEAMDSAEAPAMGANSAAPVIALGTPAESSSEVGSIVIPLIITGIALITTLDIIIHRRITAPGVTMAIRAPVRTEARVSVDGRIELTPSLAATPSCARTNKCWAASASLIDNGTARVTIRGQR